MARLPLGFADFEQLGRFSRELLLAIAREGAKAHGWVIGTAVTGWSMNVDKPATAFSDASDLDVVLSSDELIQKMMHAGGDADRSWHFLGKYMWLRNDGPSGFLTVCPHIAEFAARWSRELHRPVDIRLFIQPAESPIVEQFLALQNPMELWPPSIYDSPYT